MTFVYISRTNLGFHCMPTERGGWKSIAALSGLPWEGDHCSLKVEQAGKLKAERGEAKVVRTHVFTPLSYGLHLVAAAAAAAAAMKL